MPGIKGVLETSFVDWPGRLCAVVFLGGCNFRCPYCHNHPLVLAPELLPTLELAAVLRQLDGFREWLGGICVTGGEPTLDPDLPEMLSLLKEKGWMVKLDTNGSRPRALSRLLAARLVDMVAMDVKAPLIPEKYERCAGVAVDLARIRESIRLLQESGIAHEFRMTVLPRFHSEEEIEAWAAAVGQGQARVTLQNFNPKTTLDPLLGDEKGFPPQVFEKIRGRWQSSGKIDG